MKYVLKNCSIYDGTDNYEIRKNMNIYVDGETITKIDGEELTEGYDVIDVEGKFVMPGLINLHAHLFGTGTPSKILGGGTMQKVVIGLTKSALGPAILRSLVRTSVKQSLYAGITTVRGVGDFRFSDVDVRNEIETGKTEGSRLIVSGPAMTVPGGHGANTFSRTATDVDGFNALVDDNINHDVDLIKICITGGVMDAKKKGEPGELKMSLEQAKAVCDRAHEKGFIVASHTESAEGIAVALEAGVNTIEHGSTIDDDAVKQFKEKGSTLTCTLSPAIPLALLSPELTKLDDICVYNSKVLLDNMVSGIHTALNNSIPVGLGTDSSCPFVTPYNMWREIYWYTKYIGVSNGFALHTATLINATILGLQNVTGSIEPLKSADMLITMHNPLEDISALKDVDTVISRGKILNNPPLKKDDYIEKILDTLM